MPFELCNAPATFQSFMEEVLKPFRSFIAGLLGDFAVWGNTTGESYELLFSIFTKFIDYGLMPNLNKCRLFILEGNFPGFVISQNDISADPNKIPAIRDRQMPSTISKIAALLTQLDTYDHSLRISSKWLDHLRSNQKALKINLQHQLPIRFSLGTQKKPEYPLLF